MICIVCNKEFKTTNSRQSKLTCSSKCNNSYHRNKRTRDNNEAIKKAKDKIPEVFVVTDYEDKKVYPAFMSNGIHVKAQLRKQKIFRSEIMEVQRLDGITFTRKYTYCYLSDIEAICKFYHNKFKETYNISYRNSRNYFHNIIKENS